VIGALPNSEYRLLAYREAIRNRTGQKICCNQAAKKGAFSMMIG